MYFNYGKDLLTVPIVFDLLQGRIKGVIDNSTKEKITAASEVVNNIVLGDKAVYGINTGFGPLCTTKISHQNTKLLQYKLLLSHAVGVGNPISTTLVKIMMILKVHSLARGFSGIQIKTLERIIWHIDNDVIPYVPEKGSVGASGDLAPLSHCFLPLIGEGQVYEKGMLKEMKEVLSLHGLEKLELEPKEGLALINGTQFIAAHAVQAVHKMALMLEKADLIAAMTIDALKGSAKPFIKDLHLLRPYAGNQYVAKKLYLLLSGSEINASHKDCGRVQDPYSLRCVPQVHGASWDAWRHLKEKVEIEINAVTDNPIILGENEIISGGNFHGQPLALPLDYASIAASEIGNISDRRIYLALEGKSEGVPKLLLADTGVNSGFMILQYTTAALCSENKSLCFPSSADSIPTSLGQEDHVSMGSISGRKLLKIIENTYDILAIEWLCSAQALEFRRPLKSHKIVEELHQLIRQKISFVEEDRAFAHDIKKVQSLIESDSMHRIIKDIKIEINGSFISY